MKKLLILACLFSLFGNAQKTGVIYFKETTKFKMKIDSDDNEIMKMMPTSRDAFKVLYFSETESLQKNETKKNEDIEIKKEEDNTQLKIVIKIPENIYYQNIRNNEALNFTEFLGKDFLVFDKLDTKKWKITSEQKKILDFACMRATLQDTSKHVSAWFAPQLKSPFGPNGYSGLPGTILGLEEDNGQRLLVATSIEALPADFVFEKPSKGKKISGDEFKKIRDEKMKEMGQSSGSNGVIRTTIIRN